MNWPRTFMSMRPACGWHSALMRHNRTAPQFVANDIASNEMWKALDDCGDQTSLGINC